MSFCSLVNLLSGFNCVHKRIKKFLIFWKNFFFHRFFPAFWQKWPPYLEGLCPKSPSQYTPVKIEKKLNKWSIKIWIILPIDELTFVSPCNQQIPFSFLEKTYIYLLPSAFVSTYVMILTWSTLSSIPAECKTIFLIWPDS